MSLLTPSPTSSAATTVAPVRPVPFWSWNERLDPAEIRRQISLFEIAGWGGAFVHARVGLLTPYLGEEWFANVDATIEACAERGLGVWLYDEDKWPSGFSGGSVPTADASFRMRALIARPDDQAPPPNTTPLVRDAGLVVYEWIAPLGNPWFNGTCYGDLMGADAMQQFIHDAYAVYAERYKQHYGGLITAQFTDEPAPIFRLGLPKGAVPWSLDLHRAFIDAHGYDPIPLLPLLFLETPRSARFRLHYFDTVNDLFERSYVKPIASFCTRHRLQLTGHLMAEEGLYDQQLWGTSVMRHYRHFHMPGIDHLARQVDEVITALQCRSVVNQFAKPGMLSELYGVSGQNLSFADRWWIGSQQIALGVTQFVPHLALYTLAGCRKRDFPPNLYYQQPWWPLNRVVDGPLGRLCGLMSQGRFTAEVLVLHPQESVWTLWQSDARPADATTQDAYDHEPTAPGVMQDIRAFDQRFKNLLHTLLGGQVSFDLGDEALLDGHAQADGDQFTVGAMAYSAVVVPEMRTIRRSTLRLLRRLLDAGGLVVCTHEPPKLVDGEPSTEAIALFKRVQTCSTDELPEWLEQRIDLAVRIGGVDRAVGRKTFTHVRDLPDGSRRVLLTNLNRNNGGKVEVCCNGPWHSAALLHLDQEGEMPLPVRRSASALHVSLPLESTRTHLLELREERSFASVEEPRWGEGRTMHSKPWQCARLDDNALPLDTALWRTDGAFSSHAVPVVALQRALNERQYDGPLTLRYSVDRGDLDADRPVRLVVEHPQRWTIRVNGEPVSYDGLDPWRDPSFLPIDITRRLAGGTNSIELHTENFRHGDLASTDDIERRYGTEIEAIYLVGDFSVAADVTPDTPEHWRWAKYELPPITQYRATGARLVNATPLVVGDVTPQGLPFYVGRLRYTTSLAAAPHARRLRLERLEAAVAKVTLDEKVIGHLSCEPLTVVIPAGAGGELCITLFGTLRNLLGPHHHPEGELAAVAPPMFEPDWEQVGDVAEAVDAWGASGCAPPRWDDRYSLVAFGGLGRVTIEDARELT